jgi:AcrR family transcriptional regulator
MANVAEIQGDSGTSSACVSENLCKKCFLSEFLIEEPNALIGHVGFCEGLLRLFPHYLEGRDVETESTRRILPKAYSDYERKRIVEKLKEEAGKCMAQYGIRKTTVDELVKRVKIPKGTFYLFFSSKEQLLFDVIMDLHKSIETAMMKAISELDPETMSSEQLTDILFDFFKLTDKLPILKMLNSGEIEILYRKLSPEVLEKPLQDDNEMVKRLLSVLGIESEQELEVYSAALRALYFSTLHKEETGEEYYDKALWLLINGLVIQLLK